MNVKKYSAFNENANKTLCHISTIYVVYRQLHIHSDQKNDDKFNVNQLSAVFASEASIVSGLLNLIVPSTT